MEKIPMKRLVVLALLGAGYLLVGVVPAVAKKKPAKPIIETFEATASGVGVVRFEIEEFSTDQDIQELTQAYATGGKDAVESALDKIEKGTLWAANGAYPIRLVRSASEGGVRTLNIVAVAADHIWGDRGGQTFIGHRGYPFTFVQLKIDQQGKGRGQEVPFAMIVFTEKGAIDVKPMVVGSGANAAMPLVNVHAVSQ
jgi:hypothetical protein